MHRLAETFYEYDKGASLVTQGLRRPDTETTRRQADPSSEARHRARYDIILSVRLVLDTDVVVAALRSPQGASAAILQAARENQVSLLATVALALEYEAVCRRAEHQLASGLSDREVDVFLTAVVALTEPVEARFLWRPQLSDPADEMVLEAAINGRADALVTFNQRDFGALPSRFGVELLLPREVIRRIKP